ncbi:hypothetical protein J8J04_00505 ['Fragaria x ananassa' phyllody phytoplasma]|uniref:Uncharacterized protein n=1 Tax='Fragaria x ananassa' phyllody phytoplasma TaxID=2358428 RepID=A0ABS5K2T7_9MOLU|nr:hypothetical protein ['Fragaria x ananassa' phyllody phytoplasma]MBS2126202.1 hypothetical protein ['Fragaria x ananassa' phyllody phytoplasma]
MTHIYFIINYLGEERKNKIMNLIIFGINCFFVLAIGETIYGQASFIKKLKKEKKKIQ